MKKNAYITLLGASVFFGCEQFQIPPLPVVIENKAVENKAVENKASVFRCNKISRISSRKTPMYRSCEPNREECYGGCFERAEVYCYQYELPLLAGYVSQTASSCAPTLRECEYSAAVNSALPADTPNPCILARPDEFVAAQYAVDKPSSGPAPETSAGHTEAKPKR